MNRGWTILFLLLSFWAFPQQGYFVQNKGQLPDNVLFHAKLNYGNFYIEKDGSFKVKVLSPSQVDEVLGHHHDEDLGHHHDEDSHSNHKHGGHFPTNLIKGHNFKVQFINAKFTNNSTQKPAGNFSINYFNGQNANRWASNLAPLSEITLKEVYPNTDLKVYFKNNSIKYDFILHPNANPENLKIKYLGLSEVHATPNKITLKTIVGDVTDEKPQSYYESNPDKKLKTWFKKINEHTFQLTTSIQTISKTLIIDPQLNFASFTGASLDNWGYTATYDDNGFGYAGGIAFGGGYPTTLGSFQSIYGAGQIDMTISKFSPDGSNLIYSTYIGGSGLEAPHSMVVNSNNELVIYGITSSIDYPVSATAYDKTFNGGISVSASNVLDFTLGTDIVITKLSVNGDAILGSTYYGGSANDALNDANNLSGLSHNYADDYRGEVTTDGSNNIFISSVTSSTDLPTPGGFQPAYGGGTQDGCVAKFNQDLSAIVWGSYFGGTGDDACYASKQNSQGETYITGGTNSTNLTLNGLQSSNNGGIDGYLVRISANGASLLNGTFIGTNLYDQSYFVEIDFDDDVYCFGQSLGTMPTTSGVYQNANSKQFLQKYSEDLNTLEAATIIGSGNGSINIVPGAFMVSNCKEVYLSGWGGLVNNDFQGTRNMPITSDAEQNTTDGSDFYFMLLGQNFSTLKYGSYFGGGSLMEHVDGGTSRFDRNGTIYQAVCAGCGASSAFPVTPEAYSTTNNSTNCNLALIKMDISKLTANIKFTMDSAHCENDPVYFENQSTGGTEYQWVYPDGTISKSFDGEFYFSDTGQFIISLIAIDSTQCPYSDTADIIVDVISVPEIEIDIDTFLCANNSLTINSLGGPLDTNYSWWTNDSSFVINGPSLTVIPDSTTEYYAEYTNQCGTDTTTVEIPVFYPPTPSAIGDTVCEGDSPNYYFFNHPDYIITELNNKPFQLMNDSIYFPIDISDTYEINVEGSCGNATKTYEVDLTIIEPVSTPDTVVCAGDRLELFASGGENYFWFDSALADNSIDSSIIIYPESSQQYVNMILKGNCFKYDTVNVKVFPKPTQTVDDEYTINFTEMISVSLNPNFQYDWTPFDFLDCNKCSEVNITPDQDMKYYFTYSDSQSCQIKDSIQVNVIFPIYIPNAFTPNGDGKNDLFNAQSEILEEFELLIYNRWGNLIFETNSLTNSWNGTVNGNPQGQDVYVYKLRYVLRHTRKRKEKVGTVTLIR